MDAISSIAGLLSFCGISSMRMFAPTFLFGAICRFLPVYSWCPAEISKLAESCPHFLTSDFGLCVFGVLGILEVAANWEDSIREVLSETNIEMYAKPLFAALASYSLCSPEQLQVLSAVIDGDPGVLCDPAATNVVTNVVAAAAQSTPETAPPATGVSFAAIAASLFCGGGTFGLCKVRTGIVAAIRELDPDNALHLNTFLTLFEEGSWLAILPLVMVFPLIALMLMVILAFFGWLLSRPLKAIAEKRRAHWNAVGKEGMLKAVRTRAVVIFSLGVILSAIPVFGYLVTVVALNLFVFGVIVLYERPSSRLLAKIVMRFIKLTLFLVALVFSGVPFMGVVLLLPYAVSFLMRERKIRNASANS